MSRCFPYPPPGYCGNRAGYEALIETIKLQRESELAKAEKKKQKKRGKKEKKRSKKEVAKQNPNVGLDEKPHKGLNSRAGFEPGYEKRKEDSVEQLERSDLTEEHDQPVSLHKPSHSSDSTQNSNKRKLRASPPPIGTSGHGKIIRIRLPLQKHKEPDSGKESLCSTGGTHSSAPPRPDSFAVVGVQLTDEKSKSASGTTSKIVAQADTHIDPGSSPFDNEKRRINSRSEDLFRSWVPLVLRSQLSDPDDQEWLFGKKHQCGRQGEKRYKASGDISCCGRSAMLPSRAQYLPDTDIYALPFTVPF